jgi:hypothetical protein
MESSKKKKPISEKSGDSSARIVSKKKTTSLTPAKELPIITLGHTVEQAFLGCIAVLVHSISEVDYSHATNIATFIRSAPEIIKSCFNQSYAAYLLDNDIDDAVTPSDYWGTESTRLVRFFKQIQDNASSSVEGYLSSLRKLETKLNEEHSTRALELQQSCDEANSGSIIVPADFAGFMAMNTFEQTANANIARTDAAIEEHLAACQDEYDRYTYNLGRSTISNFLFEIMPDIARLFYHGFFDALYKNVGINPDDFLTPAKINTKGDLYVTSKRYDELKKMIHDFIDAKPYALGLVGSYGSLRKELDAREKLGMNSIIAALYYGDSIIFSDASFTERQCKLMAEYLDFIVNDPRCVSVFRSYLLLADSPTGYTGEDYAQFLNELSALGWKDPLLCSNYSQDKSAALLRDNYYSTMVGKTARFDKQGLYHYYESDHYWRCQCGSFNLNEFDRCLLCGKPKSEIKTIETDPTYVSPVAKARVLNSPAYKNKQSLWTAFNVTIPFLFIVSLFLVSGVRIIVDEYVYASQYVTTAQTLTNLNEPFDSLGPSAGRRFAAAMIFFGIEVILTLVFSVMEKRSKPSGKKTSSHLSRHGGVLRSSDGCFLCHYHHWCYFR